MISFIMLSILIFISLTKKHITLKKIGKQGNTLLG